jgi:hypothetical protein
MIHTPAPLVLTALQEKLASTSGRHLYGILGSYKRLQHFEENDLPQAKLSSGEKLQAPANLNKAILERIEGGVLQELVNSEGKMPLTIAKRLAIEFDNLLAVELSKSRILILKGFELLYAYNVEMECLRRRATNDNHIVLLLPGTLQNDRILLFHETGQENHRIFHRGLITQDHLWELKYE